MKPAIFILLVFLAACGPASSPEKRMTTKTDSIQKQVDSVKKQNEKILDSIQLIEKELKEMREKK